MADPVIQVPVLVDTGESQVLVCSTIALPAPAFEIIEIRKTVIIDSCTVIPGKVIIDGRLRKNILFKTLTAGTVPPRAGTVVGCNGIVNTASGDLAHTTVDIAFNAFVPVDDACPGDICEVAQAFVEGEAEEPVRLTAAGTFTELLDKSVIRLCVAVKRTRALRITAEEDVDVCPPGLTAGLAVTGQCRTIDGSTRLGGRPGTAVGPTVVFGGPGVPLVDP